MEQYKFREGITGGLFLIGLGVIFLANWFWPGILVVIGIAAVSDLVLRGRYSEAIVPALIFFGIPLLVVANIGWHIYGPVLLITLGLVVLAKNLLLGESAR